MPSVYIATVSREKEGMAASSSPRSLPPRNVIPIATTITFNRVEHTIVVIELIYKLPPRTIVSAKEREEEGEHRF